MIILGIDPGSVNCGWGAVRTGSGNKLELIEYGVIRVRKAHEAIPARLKEIYTRICGIIERVGPDCAVFESTFYSHNAQSLMKLSHARAAAILAAAMNDIPVKEYSPKEVKKSVTGRGAAGKGQVDYMVRSMLGIDETPEFYDATDALAVAICYSVKRGSPAKNSGSWADYINKNSNRIIDPNKR
jgi:crossover junction endodeoxyribonuclease RuvC